MYSLTWIEVSRVLSTESHGSRLKLSICIATFNRANFIGATLESILSQLTDECEIVILDGASTDHTEQVLSEYRLRFNRLRYVRQTTNNGIDRDYDRAVGLARGEYCWLMPDDDFLKPGAISTVLGALSREPSLVMVNIELRSFDMSKVMQARRLDFTADRVYRPGEMDRLFVEAGHYLTYCGSAIIKKALWMSRERERYYGTLYVHVGVIFQQPLPSDALVIAAPLVSYRMGNTHTFSPEVIETQWIRWPGVVHSLALSDSAKNAICGRKPWRSFRELILWRGFGYYSMTEYRKLIFPQLASVRESFVPTFVAMLPGILVNALCILYYRLTQRPHRSYRGVWPTDVVLHSLRDSRYHPRNWRAQKQR